MANLFIGFPVPRAKIADMIEGAAPPLEHHDRHEDGGDDQIDATGLEGAGGITFPLSDYIYNTLFESLDGFEEYVYAGGAVTIDEAKVHLQTDGTEYCSAGLKKEPVHQAVALTWDKKREFHTQIYFRAVTVANTLLKVGTGDLNNADGFGFVVIDGVLKALSQSGANQEVHTIEDWSGAAFAETRRLRAHKTGASEVKFYVDDVLVYTATTYVPTGTDDAEKVLEFMAYNAAGGSMTWIEASDYSFWQEG